MWIDDKKKRAVRGILASQQASHRHAFGTDACHAASYPLPQAQRLTLAWQKAVKKAATAYSSGNHSKARRLAAEAQRLRLDSLAAHEAAAARIEQEANAGARCVLLREGAVAPQQTLV